MGVKKTAGRSALQKASPAVLEVIATLVREVPGMTDSAAKAALYRVMREQAKEVDARAKRERGGSVASGRAGTVNVVQATEVANNAWCSAMDTLDKKKLRLQDLPPQYLRSLVIKAIGRRYHDMLRKERRRPVHSEGSKVRVRRAKAKDQADSEAAPMTRLEVLSQQIVDNTHIAQVAREKGVSAMDQAIDLGAGREATRQRVKDVMQALDTLREIDIEQFSVFYEYHIAQSDGRATYESVSTKLGLTPAKVRKRLEDAAEWLRQALDGTK